jgi:hypothetical protein
MKFRLQYSLLTLIVVTTLCAVVVAYVVVPWRHEKRQTEIIELLKAHNDNQYNLYEGDKINSYVFNHSSFSSESLQFFVDHMQDCDRIHTVRLDYECFTDDQLAKLKQLPKLTRLELENCALNEARMQILGSMSLKELQLTYLESISFSAWPLQPLLESFSLRFIIQDYSAPPLKLVSHPRLRVLEIDSCPQSMHIESCLKLTHLKLSPPAEDQFTTLKLTNLPHLEELSLSFEDKPVEFQIAELPALQSLSIDAELFQFFSNHPLSNLREFTCRSDHSLNPTELAQILQFPKLERLVLRANWAEYERANLPIPLLPKLQDLNLSEAWRMGKFHIPEQIAIRFLRQCPALQSLYFPLEDASDEFFAEVAKLPELRHLCLHVQGKVGDLSVLSNCKKLEDLELSFFDLPPSRIADFNKLNQIKKLNLHHHGTEDIEMAALQARPKLAVHYNRNVYTNSFPVMLPDRKAPLRDAFKNVAPAETAPATQ